MGREICASASLGDRASADPDAAAAQRQDAAGRSTGEGSAADARAMALPRKDAAAWPARTETTPPTHTADPQRAGAAAGPARAGTAADDRMAEGGAPAAGDGLIRGLARVPGRAARLQELERLLAGDHRRKVNWASFARTSLGEIAASLIAVSLSSALGRACMMGVAAGSDRLYLGSMGMMSMISVVSQQTAAIAHKVVEAWTGAANSPAEHLRAAHDVLLRRLARARPAIPQERARAVDRLDTVIAEHLKCERWDKVGRLLRVREGLLLSVPERVVDVSHQRAGADPTRRRQIDEAVAGLLAEYPGESRAALGAFIGQIRANCFLREPGRAQIYLQGAAGTGKTRFALRLAQALGLPLCNLQFGKQAEHALLEPHWQLDTALEMGGPQDDDANLIGLVPRAIFESDIANPIIFIDEVDEILNDPNHSAMFKILLNPDYTRHTMRSLDGLSLDLSRVTFILAGNARLTDAALLSPAPARFTSAASVANRSTAWWWTSSSRSSPTTPPSPPMFWSSSAPASRLWPRVSSPRTARRGVPGVRIALEVAKSVISHARGGLLAGQPPTLSEQDRFIAQCFAERQCDAIKEASGRTGHPV